MSRQQSTHWDTPECNRVHREKLQRKVEKIDVLKALLEMHEANPDHDHEYILELRAKLRQAQNQLEAMSL